MAPGLSLENGYRVVLNFVPIKDLASLHRDSPIRKGVRYLRTRYVRDFRIWRATRRRLRLETKFIGVTGSSAKSTTTALLSHVLAGAKPVPPPTKFNQMMDLVKRIEATKPDSAFNVIEIGVAGDDTIERQTACLRPDVAIVTLVALEHYSLFRDVETIARKKGSLVAAVRASGFAALNADDDQVMGMAGRCSGRVVTFGKSPGADFQAKDLSCSLADRLSLTVIWRGNARRLRTQFAAEHFWLSTVAAFAVAVELGLSPDLVASRIASFKPLGDRCGITQIEAGPTFVVDTAKAPLHSIDLAMKAVTTAAAPRRRLVLGHISDFGSKPKKIYRDIYRRARDSYDEVIYVGEHAHRSGASPEDKQAGRFHAFATTEQAADYIRQSAVAGEIILLKGSSNLHLERIALDWTHEVECWQDRCGKHISCYDCGLYEIAFSQHG